MGSLKTLVVFGESEATKKDGTITVIKIINYIESFWGESSREGLFAKSSSLGKFFLFSFLFMTYFSKRIPDHTRHKDGGEETCDDTYDKGKCELLDRFNTEDIDHTDGEKGGDGGVNASAEGFVNRLVNDIGKFNACFSLALFSRTRSNTTMVALIE